MLAVTPLTVARRNKFVLARERGTREMIFFRDAGARHDVGTRGVKKLSCLRPP